MTGDIKPPRTDRQAYQRLLSPRYYGYSKADVARMLGIRRQAITRWENIPLKYVREISEVTGIPREFLRPSDFA